MATSTVPRNARRLYPKAWDAYHLSSFYEVMLGSPIRGRECFRTYRNNTSALSTLVSKLSFQDAVSLQLCYF